MVAAGDQRVRVRFLRTDATDPGQTVGRIDTSIIAPGSFTSGTNHYAHAGHPADTDTAAAYEEASPGLMENLLAAQATLSPDDADPEEVARQIVHVVGLPKGERPFRVYIVPAEDGAEEVFRIGDRIRAEFYRAVGYEELLRPLP
jgi:hypothetical protein